MVLEIPWPEGASYIASPEPVMGLDQEGIKAALLHISPLKLLDDEFIL